MSTSESFVKSKKNPIRLLYNMFSDMFLIFLELSLLLTYNVGIFMPLSEI